MAHKRNRRKIFKKGLPPESLVYTGHREDTPANVVSVSYTEAAFEEIQGYVAPRLEERKGVLWTDVRGLTDTKLIEKVGMDHGIHALALEDVLDTQQRAKLEEFDNGLFFIVHNLKIDCVALELHSEQIALFAGKNFLVSFQEDPDDTFAVVRKRVGDGIGRLRRKGSDYLAYAIIDLVVDSYYSVLDDLEAQELELENDLHQNGAAHTTKARMFALKRTANEFRHRLLPLREAVTRLHRTESDLIDDSNRLYFRDLVDHVAQILDGIDNQREMLANLEALYQAEAANRLNNVMRLLTVISTIFIPLTFIVGIYGMNFDYMPELRWHYGYFIVLGVMFCLMIGMLIYFRRKRWI
ncbi:MAG: magnesium/cobalt transporter CorA [Saprospiraceae bacterium]|nr:magnesium/cobalt transporter CorA [Saprospiraceae bacterium]